MQAVGIINHFLSETGKLRPDKLSQSFSATFRAKEAVSAVTTSAGARVPLGQAWMQKILQ